MNSVLTLDAEARSEAEEELAEVAEKIENPPDLEDVRRRRMPMANGDQDTW